MNNQLIVDSRPWDYFIDKWCENKANYCVNKLIIIAINFYNILHDF